jgi:DNA-binding transcriptional LysR family regulator
MELRHLRYFIAIAEEGSFTRAAERLWIAQPGLSTQIRRLEDELGVRLFERHTRGVQLTSAGELFLERARVAVAAADVAGATGQDLGRGLIGAVRLGIATSARWNPTGLLLERFCRERERVELTVLEGYGGTLARDLRDRRLDAVVSPSMFASGELRSLELGTEPWIVLVGDHHPLAGAGPLSAADLQGERIAVTAHRDGACYDRAVAAMLGQLEVTARLVDVGPEPAMGRAVKRGEALVLTTAPVALPEGVLARPLRPARLVPFSLLWRDETPSPALGEFIRIAADLAGQRPMTGRPLAAAV